ncbi:hypothetical protein CGRA01v4_08890 [Colletotrichum graminicola]|nr:hypothetical protein CGRA01v4_08890 [Colletotrichum graminicola]
MCAIVYTLRGRADASCTPMALLFSVKGGSLCWSSHSPGETRAAQKIDPSLTRARQTRLFRSRLRVPPPPPGCADGVRVYVPNERQDGPEMKWAAPGHIRVRGALLIPTSPCIMQ